MIIFKRASKPTSSHKSSSTEDQNLSRKLVREKRPETTTSDSSTISESFPNPTSASSTTPLSSNSLTTEKISPLKSIREKKGTISKNPPTPSNFQKKPILIDPKKLILGKLIQLWQSYGDYYLKICQLILSQDRKFKIPPLPIITHNLQKMCSEPWNYHHKFRPILQNHSNLIEFAVLDLISERMKFYSKKI
jgi:hypothetical protein